MRTNPRRQFLRHTVHVPLEIEQVSDSRKEERGVNVSYGGLAFESARCYPIGEVLQLRIRTVEPEFQASGKVAWCRPEGTGYLVGVEFMDSTDAFQSRMVQQVCSIENYRKKVLEEEGRELSTDAAAAEWIERYAGRFPDSDVISEEGRSAA